MNILNILFVLLLASISSIVAQRPAKTTHGYRNMYTRKNLKSLVNPKLAKF